MLPMKIVLACVLFCLCMLFLGAMSCFLQHGIVAVRSTILTTLSHCLQFTSTCLPVFPWRLLITLTTLTTSPLLSLPQ